MEKKTKKKSKFKEIRSAVTMMCVMVAMMSTATYAWFTLTSSPTVTSLQMTAASTGGLVVAPKNEEGSYVNAMQIEVDEDMKNANGKTNPLKLQPVSVGKTDDVINGFCLPQYSGGVVTGLKAPMTDAELNEIVAVYTYYIKSEEGDVGVGIITGDATTTAPTTVTGTGAAAYANAAGTFVRSKVYEQGEATDGARGDAAQAIRIGLVVTNPGSDANMADMIILEPNNNKHENETLTGVTSATENPAMTGPVAKVSFEQKGNITTGGTGTISDYLFTAGEEAKQVTMYVWLEGTDADCVDQIKADVIEAQIQFTTVDIPTP